MGRIAGVTAAETRERLLRAAADVFAERGYDGTRVADIAAAAGVSNGALELILNRSSFYRCWSEPHSQRRNHRERRAPCFAARSSASLDVIIARSEGTEDVVLTIFGARNGDTRRNNRS
jgi:hypothetical protein